MRASFWKRAGAYLIDFIIVASILTLVLMSFPENNKTIELRQNLNELYDSATNQMVTIEHYVNEYASLVHFIDKEIVLENVANAIIIIAYFTILPYIWNGQTIGKRLFKLRIVRDDGKKIMINELLVRNMIVSGLGYVLLSLALVFALSSLAYFMTITLLGLVQVVIFVITVVMMLGNKRKGLQDIITKTHVIDEEKTNN